MCKNDKETNTTKYRYTNIVVKLITSAHKYLKPYSTTPEIDKILGKELAEFYRKREETLTRRRS